MLNTEAVLGINTDILRSCLMAHATRDFSGDLRFAHAGEIFTWKRVEFHSDRGPDADFSRALQEHWPSVMLWIPRESAELEVSFRSGKVTRTQICSRS